MAPTAPVRDPSSVYRVVRLVATHESSWEAAASHGIAELAKTITDLRWARVVRRDVVARDGAVAWYRLELEASYRVDRRRVVDTATVTVRRYLVVANETFGSDALDHAIAERLQGGPAEFHVLVPATLSRWGIVAAAGMGEAGTGYAHAEAAGLMASRAEAIAQAETRLAEQLARLQALGAVSTGEVGSADPIDAIANVLARASFDEVIVATLPAAVSRWLRLDLPSRVQRRFGTKVVHVET